ncbi:hypothetical protein G7054_g143 [Neopestalotiopsis clavispora]|nr:hypothetical protein G7054_g143 [Neopestalotiopsis clavispora]
MALNRRAHYNDQNDDQASYQSHNAYEKPDTYEIFCSLMDITDAWKQATKLTDESHDLGPIADSREATKSPSNIVKVSLIECWAYYYHSQAQLNYLRTASEYKALSMQSLVHVNEKFYDTASAELEKVKALDHDLGRQLRRGLLLMGTRVTVELLEMAAAILNDVKDVV